jgi:trimethylamine---corrinoid protein Co-methyltransferase
MAGGAGKSLPGGALRFRRLTNTQCRKLHDASLQILERTGVRFYEPEAVDLVKKAGAAVSDGNRVRIPARLVEWALSTVPKEVTLYDRNGHPVMPLAGACTYFGAGSDCLNIVDHRTGTRRSPLLRDVADGMAVCDALPNIDFVMSMFLPSDVRQDIADRYQMEVMLNSTTKPIIYVTYEKSGCVDAVEMAEAVAGGATALRRKPFVACYINVTTGLRHNDDALQKLLYLAEKGLPALYIPVALAGATGPITLAGCVAAANAGVLAGLLVSQLKREGAPVIIPGFGGIGLDMHSMVMPYCEPDYRGVAEALAHHYNLPMFSLGGVSDSKLVDQQAAAEAALTLLVDALAGGNIIHDLGYLESGLSGSLAQLVICNEIVSWIKNFMQPMEINAETLALDLIDEIGPDGQFLDSDHTLRHFRERWYPQVFERESYQKWLDKGGTTLAERAARKVDAILSAHKPQPLAPGIAQRVHAVVQRAEG